MSIQSDTELNSKGTMTVRIESRLMNFKFDSALRYVLAGDEVSPEVRAMIESLSMEYGNVGWFYGAVSERIWAQLETIGVNRPWMST